MRRQQRRPNNGHSNGHNTNNNSRRNGYNNNQSRGSSRGELMQQLNRYKQQRQRYLDLARDAKTTGEVVDVEYNLQYADHFTRQIDSVEAQLAKIDENFNRKRAMQEAMDADAPAENSSDENADDDASDDSDAEEEEEVSIAQVGFLAGN